MGFARAASVTAAHGDALRVSDWPAVKGEYVRIQRRTASNRMKSDILCANHKQDTGAPPESSRVRPRA